MSSHEQLIDALRTLSDKDFIEAFYAASRGRHLFEAEKDVVDCGLPLANAIRERSDDGAWTEWRLQLLCPVPEQEWTSEAPICQFGEHCGHETASWSKHAICPVCGGDVYGT